MPVVFHLLHRLRGGGAAQHSHSPQAMLWKCPGLQIVLLGNSSESYAASLKEDVAYYANAVKLFGAKILTQNGA